ncbi:MAG: winged helix-turn-helix domain-containing protein [Candidatus Bathyarchaeia archaeon]
MAENEEFLNSDEVFDAVSHPLRIKILKRLAKSPLSFSELKRAINVESSGALDFHLKKMQSLIESNSDGRYILNNKGSAALEAVNVIEQYGWQKRSFLLNFLVYVLLNIWVLAIFSFSSYSLVVFVLSTLWLGFYSYWTFVRRRVPLRQK